MACARGCCPTQRDHYKSLVFDTTSKQVDTKGFDSDMDAYARLRRDGVQPPRVSGAAYREKHATTEAQIEGRPEGTPSTSASLAELRDWEP